VCAQLGLGVCAQRLGQPDLSTSIRAAGEADLRYFSTFDKLIEKVDSTLRYLAELPSAIKAVMGRYCEAGEAKIAA